MNISCEPVIISRVEYVMLGGLNDAAETRGSGAVAGAAEKP